MTCLGSASSAVVQRRGTAAGREHILRFRRLLEAHDLAAKMLATANDTLSAKGLLLKFGSVVDATLIAAPGSTNNRSGSRDPEMNQTKKGNKWHFGMQAHIGADADSGQVHTVVGIGANVNDVTVGNDMPYGSEKHVFADAGYQGADKRPEAMGQTARWHVAMRPSGRRKWRRTPRIGWMIELAERHKALVRPKVEHPFRVIKRQVGYAKVRYRGLLKNTAQLMTLFALSHLRMALHQLLRTRG